MNFVVNICGCETKWTAENIIEDAVARIKEQVGDDEVIFRFIWWCGLFCGCITFTPCYRQNLHCVFVDNGYSAYMKATKLWKCLAINSAEHYPC